MNQQQIVDLLAAFGPGLLSGVGQGGQASADRAQTELERRRQAEQEAYNRRLQARAGLAGFYQNQLTRDTGAAQDLAAQAPLGAEQALAQQMARRRMAPALAAQFQNQSGSNPMATAAMRGAPNLLAPFASEDYQATVSKDATARSIAERRKALAGLDPNFQFGSMGDYGLPDLGDEVSQYQGDVRSRRQASEMDLQRLLTEQMREASAAQIPGAETPTATGATATTKKKPSMLRRIAGAALPVAAAFIPGVGPVASALIQAGAGAAGSALAGGGLKGALTGAAMGGLGAATGGLGSAAGRKVAGETTKSFVQRAILNPRALTQIAGGALGGDTGTALQAASLGMAGATRPGALDTSFEQQGLPGNLLPGGGSYANMTTSPGSGPLDTSFEQRNVSGLLPGGGALTTAMGAAPAAARGGGQRRAATPPPTSFPLTPEQLEQLQQLERGMPREQLQLLPVTSLTKQGKQLAYGPAAGAMQMFGGPEGRPTGEEIVGDLAGAGMLAALLSSLGLGPVAAGAGAAAAGAGAAGASTLVGQAVRNVKNLKRLPGGTRSSLRLPAGTPRPALPGTQSIPLPGGGVLNRDVGSPFFRLPGGGIMYR